MVLSSLNLKLDILCFCVYFVCFLFCFIDFFRVFSVFVVFQIIPFSTPENCPYYITYCTCSYSIYNVVLPLPQGS